MLSRLLDARNDLQRYVRHHLYVAPLVFEIALLLDDTAIDTPCGHVVDVGYIHVQETLVVAHVLVSLKTVLKYEHLAVFSRVHRTCIDVDVRVDLHGSDYEATRLKDLRN